MSTGTAIIDRALRMIDAQSSFQDAPPESFQIALEMLNSMLQTWLSNNIVLNVQPLEALGDELGEPNDTRNAIIYNLAIVIAPIFSSGDTVISPDLLRNSVISLANVSALYRVVLIPPKGVSSTLPRGAGNTRGVQRRVFAGRGAVVDG